MTARRTVLAAAWTVPVITIAQPAPSFAASGPTVTTHGTACKQPPHRYRFTLAVNGHTPGSVLTIATVELPNSPATVVHGATTTLPAGRVLVPVVVEAGNSANGAGTVSWTLNGQTGVSVVVFDGFHPCPKDAA